ncbi:MAG TPA: pyrroline-5-carboxylate reductase [Bacteroidota bacterium]|nr:pyrroline-5-carboxylate reductase [Bacteroidota bacterium]
MAEQSGKRIAILGAGNIGSAIARGLVAGGVAPAKEITLTRRILGSLGPMREEGFALTSDNVAAVRGSEMVFIAVPPRQLDALLDEIRPGVDPRRHTIVSIVTGATIAGIRAHLGSDVPVIRAMPNTAIAIRQSMTCLATDGDLRGTLAPVRKMFDALGRTLVIEEGLMVPATALCACGIAFFLRAIRAASQGGIEIGFHAGDALLMAAQTARGAASLLVEGGTHPEGEVDRVTTPQGCTISGLNQMEHSGFSSALIKGIVTSAEKAALLYAPRQSGGAD